MQILRLCLQNFRSFPFLVWEPVPTINVITGGNAQGKTNLLEAIFFGLTGRSFRTPHEREVICWGSSFCRVELELEFDGRNAQVTVLLSSEGEKKILVDGKAGRLWGGFCAPVLFSPDHLLLVKGSPALRRRWLDQELCQLQPGYSLCLRRYQQVLAHRNRLLMELREKKCGSDALEPWSHQLVDLGSRIISWRCQLLAEVAPLASRIYHQISAEEERFNLSYLSSFPLGEIQGEEEVRVLFLRELSKRLSEEVAWGQTLVGPHRDDLKLTIDGRDARRYASLGQQRTAVLALKLAQLELAAKFSSTYPVVLLDDVFSEIDDRRRKLLLEYLASKSQVFLTTSLAKEALPDALGRVFVVRQSTISEGG